MQFLLMLAGVAVAALGQFLNAKKSIPTAVVKVALALCGMGFYLIIAQPKAWLGQPLLDWFDVAFVWALALPGLASFIALHPAMKTDSQP